MKLLLPVRRGAGDDEPVFGMRPKQIAARIGAAARQGEGVSEVAHGLYPSDMRKGVDGQRTRQEKGKQNISRHPSSETAVTE